MAARHELGLVSVLAALLGAAGCSETPTSPAPPTSRSYAPLDVRCWIEGTLLCGVNRFGDGDLTDKAEGFATDMPWGTTADPSVTPFARPGVPVASRSVKRYIILRT